MNTRTSGLLPVAAAIGVFGVVYGAAAAPLLGPWLTVASSILVFSGAAQFTMVGLLAVGASPTAVLWAVAILNLRHLALGALLRPHLADATRARRAAAAWFVIDETTGLALLEPHRTGTVLLRAGVTCYAAWVAGTAVGVAGAALPALEPLAAAVFPVLFVGLAALTTSGRAAAIRTLTAAGLTGALLLLWPGFGGIAPLVAAIVVAVPGPPASPPPNGNSEPGEEAAP